MSELRIMVSQTPTAHTTPSTSMARPLGSDVPQKFVLSKHWLHIHLFRHVVSPSFLIQDLVKLASQFFVLASLGISFTALAAAAPVTERSMPATMARTLRSDVPQKFVLGNRWLHICFFRHVFSPPFLLK